MNRREEEQKIYQDIYDTEGSEYGTGTHGNGAYLFVAKHFKPESILDVGCGKDNLFCSNIVKELDKFGVEHNIELLASCDFVKFPNSAGEGDVYYKDSIIQADAHNLFFAEDNEYDVITSFDMLEHILPEDIDKVLDEFNRVAKKGFCFSIAYHQVKSGLHRIIQPEEWWMEKLSKYGKVGQYMKYIYVTK